MGLVAKGNGLARIADDDEVAAKGWTCPSGSKVVVFDPPHDVARFAAFKTLDEGVAAWVGYYQARVMPKAPDNPGRAELGRRRCGGARI